ncbi:Transmembrane protein [Trema orientale]|uniref:Transmembrane protein n=1 Tax=Trema orientale TaxID=63057 RepID=A0A2P5DYA7_TREOI|nr:Transmembrane protein [Trema orientale]
MKAWSRFLAALALSVSLILSSWSCGSRAEARSITKGHLSSASKTASSSQAVKDLQTKSKETPYKQVGSCFRRIPPSTSNPTQNKSNPP